MKIGGLQPFTLSDYPGHCAAIIFTIGCNFRCPYCHNKILLDEENARPLTELEVFNFLEDKQGKLDGVVITGGEPTLQSDLEDFIRRVRKLNYKIKLDTNGSKPDILRQLIDNQLVDYIAMDIKAPFAKYPEAAGVDACMAHINESMEIIMQSGVDHVFRTTWDKTLLTADDIETIEKLFTGISKFVIQECRRN
jgi:pyruvate formate lyase activating enzyme